MPHHPVIRHDAAETDAESGGNEMSEWQPIDTAPKDGSMFLICDRQWVFPAWYDDAENIYKWKFVDDTSPDGFSEEGNQSTDYIRFNAYPISNPPGWWMPLPAPPKAT